MSSSPLMLVDRNRKEQLRRLLRRLCFSQNAETWTDENRLTWFGKRGDELGFAICALGPGWVFDTYCQRHRADELAGRREHVDGLGAANTLAEMRSVVRQMRFGDVLGRVFWSIHRRAIECRRSVFSLVDSQLRQQVWGGDPHAAPKDWRSSIARAMNTLSWLHLGTGDSTNNRPTFGTATAVLTHFADRRGSASDDCEDDCPLRGGPRHHHFLINIGRGFLGCLEHCCVEDGADGIRLYEFPARGAPRTGSTLKRLGSAGNLVSIFVPALLGEPRHCDALTPRQHQLLQALVREITRRRRRSRRAFSEPEVTENGIVPNAQGRAEVSCPILTGTAYFGFNGNGTRRGCGYRLCSHGGWLVKAGYQAHEVGAFFEDLTYLTSQLDLTLVGLLPGTNPVQWYDGVQLRQLAQRATPSALLQRINLRIYAPADCFDRWNARFGWPYPSPLLCEENLLGRLNELITRSGISRKALARGLRMDASLLSKILHGRRRCPAGLIDRVQAFLRRPAGVGADDGAAMASAVTATMSVSTGSNLDIALRYRARGWAVIPQQPGKKKPHIRWKPYQDQLPTEDEIRRWWSTWPDAGIALIAGPLSGVLVVDVDGPEAHEEMIRRLGGEPCAPKVLSGSREPHRYHLFFRHPNLPTKSKKTPWHDKLEFRGHAGLVVLPPSRHKSGHFYNWEAGRSLDEMYLPELPTLIYEALNAVTQIAVPRPPGAIATVTINFEAADSTRRFLSGEFAEGPKWNSRLFAAAADLVGRGVPLAQAEPLLIHGARPWNGTEEENAQRTIASAYSQPRVAGRY